MEFRQPVRLLILVAALAVLGSFSACTSEDPTPDSGQAANAGSSERAAERSTQQPNLEDVEQEAQEAIEALEAYGAGQRDDAISAAKAAMDEQIQRIDALEKRIDEKQDDMSEAARRKARATVSALRKRQEALAESYDRMKTSSAAAWVDMKQGFSSAYGSLALAAEEAVKEFESGDRVSSEGE